jgi:DUF4097 and DUF4098 domain-containing protein YvlB
MKKFLVVAALIAAAPLLDAFEESEHITRTLTFEPGGTLRLTTFSGQVTITGVDGNQASIDASRHGTRERLDRIKLDIHSSGSTLYIDANHRDRSWLDHMRNNVVDTDLDVKIPRRTSLRVTTFSAPVTVDGVEGSYQLHGFSSRLRLNDIAGPVEAKTFSGSVELRVRNWREGETIDVNTFSGDIELQVPESANGHVSFNSFSGHFKSDLPVMLRGSSRRNVSADLGSGGPPSLRFHTFSGSVRILR